MKMIFITPKKAIACPRLWKDFPCNEVKKATLYITGLGLYRAYLNGQRVGEDYLTPGFNDYDAYLRYQTYDVTGLLEKDNRLEVWLGNGWYKGRLVFGGGAENNWGDKYYLAARLEITLKNGEKQIVETDDTWLAAQSAIVSGSIYDGETRDDTRDAGETVGCAAVETKYQLEPQFSPCVRVKDTRKPVLIHTPAGEQVLDFGQNFAGVIRFVNRLPRGAKMRIQTGEVLQQGNFYRDNLRSALSEFNYVSDGQVKEIEPLFTFYGFRYARVEGVEKVNPEDYTGVVLSSDLRETLRVETSDDKLNRLMLNALWGQRSNFVDLPTDCPQRDERLGWTADTQVFVNTACYQMDCKDFYRKFMRDLRADQTLYYHGDIPAFSPSVRGKTHNGGAVWADAATIIPWNVYQNYGDLELLRENYPMMRDYVEYHIREDQENGGTHIVFPAFTYGDWLAQDGLTPQSVFGGTNEYYIKGLYYLHSLELTAKAAQVLGEEADAEKYAALAGEVKSALLDEYFSPNGNLTVDTQTAYVLALAFHVYRRKEKLIAGFLRRLERDFYRLTTGFTGTPLLLPVLFDNGLTDAAYRILLTEEFPGWLYAVNLGATTIWERWNSLEADGTISGTGMNSLNHYAYGSVCEAIYSRIMGLQNAAPGWKKALIAPKISGRLHFTAIDFDSPAGKWHVDWKIGPDGRVTLRSVVPAGASAHVTLPDHPENFEADVEAGEYEWTWQPTKDYLHPFSLDSRMMDVMENAAAAGVIRALAPKLYDACQGSRNEQLLKKAGDAAKGKRLDQAALEALDRALRGVTI